MAKKVTFEQQRIGHTVAAIDTYLAWLLLGRQNLQLGCKRRHPHNLLASLISPYYCIHTHKKDETIMSNICPRSILLLWFYMCLGSPGTARSRSWHASSFGDTYSNSR